jgi:hypothetical protein
MHVDTQHNRLVADVLSAQAAGEGLELLGARQLRQQVRWVYVHALFDGARRKIEVEAPLKALAH